VSKARDLEARLERAEQELRLFQRVSRLMTRDMDLDEVLQEIVSLVRAFLNCDSCLIYLKEDEELVLFASSDGDRKNLGRVRLRLNEGLTGWVARERRLLAISREAYSDPRFKFFSDLPEDTYEAFLSVPITARQVTLGVINVQHRAPHAHTRDQIEHRRTGHEMRQIG